MAIKKKQSTYKYYKYNPDDYKHAATKRSGKSKHQRHPRQEDKFSKLSDEEKEAVRREFIEMEQHLYRLCVESAMGSPILTKVEPLEYYRDMFPEGTFETCEWLPEMDDNGVPQVDAAGNVITHPWTGLDRKPNGMISVIKDADQRGRSYTRIIFDDLAEITANMDKVAEKILVSPIAYCGRRRISDMAYKVYGMTIDLDEVGIDQLEDLIFQMQNDIIPMATYLIHTGSGLHLSYLFEYPMPAMPCYYESLNRLKAALSDLVWNKHTSRDNKKQFQSVFQGFRMVGSATKLGQAYRYQAYKFGEKVTLNYLNDFVGKDDKCEYNDITHVTIDEAQERWEKWYVRRIIEERPVGDYSFTTRIEELQRLEPTKENLKEIDKCYKELARRRSWYESWKERLRKGAFDGNRHYCVGVLFHYAMKAEIPISEALDYALSIVDDLNKLTKKPGNQFTKEDVYAATVYYDRAFIKMGRNGIKRLTTIDIGETTRKGRSQKTHLKLARANRDVLCSDRGKENWWDGGGRPVGSGTKQQIVQEWRQAHPDGKKADCIRDTGLSKPTVLKWWDSDNRQD